jgi:hypothetical protein
MSHAIAVGFGALLLIVGGPIVYGEEIKSDFRRAKVDKGEFNWDGPKAETYITPAADGLRWRFTKDLAPKKAVGISWKTRIDGNFTATAQYEILRVERPAQGSGVGPELYLTFDTAEPRDALLMTRVLQPSGEAVINVFHMTNDDKKNRIGKLIARQAATPRSLKGRMRLARDGKTFIAALAEADDDEFREIGRAELGDMRVLKVRFAGLEGGSANPELDMRLLEFHLTERKLFVPTPAPKSGEAVKQDDAPTPTPPPERDRSSLWIVIALVGVGVLAVLAVAALIVVSRLKGSPPRPEPKKKRST